MPRTRSAPTAHTRPNPTLPPAGRDIDALRDFVDARGACTVTPPTADWDPWADEIPIGHTSRRQRAARARAACSGCLVRTQCLELALQLEATTGTSWCVWGGLAAWEREEILEKRRRTAAAADTVAAVLTAHGLTIPTGQLSTGHAALLARLVLAALHAATHPVIATALLRTPVTPARTASLAG